MIKCHSTNKTIKSACKSINTDIRKHAYNAVTTGFKVRTKAELVDKLSKGTIPYPSSWDHEWAKSWFFDSKNKFSKKKEAECFWRERIYDHCQSSSEADFVFTKPTKSKGYMSELIAAAKLKTFTWAELMLSIPHYKNLIEKAYEAWGKWCNFTKFTYDMNGKPRSEFITFERYANNYHNSYRAYFVKNRIITKVKGTKCKYQLTENGKQLLAGLYQIV